MEIYAQNVAHQDNKITADIVSFPPGILVGVTLGQIEIDLDYHPGEGTDSCHKIDFEPNYKDTLLGFVAQAEIISVFADFARDALDNPAVFSDPEEEVFIGKVERLNYRDFQPKKAA